MKAHTLANLLLNMKNVNVFFCDPNSNGGPFSANSAEFKIADKDEFPKNFKMPGGFEYIILEN